MNCSSGEHRFEIFSQAEDSESNGIMAGLIGHHPAGKAVGVNESIDAPQISFKDLYSALSQSFDDSFVEDDIVETRSASQEGMGHIASVARDLGMPNTEAYNRVPRGNNDASSGSRLEQSHIAANRRLVSVRSVILLYTLLTVSPAFRDFVFARDDLDKLAVPLLRCLQAHYYRGRERHKHLSPHRPLPPAHLYVVMVLILMISQDESFQAGAFTRSIALSKAGALHGWFSFGSIVLSSAIARVGEASPGTGVGQSLLSLFSPSQGTTFSHAGELNKPESGDGSAGVLGNVMLVVLIRSMQAEATHFRWSTCKAKIEAAGLENNDNIDSDSIRAWVPCPSAYQCESLCAVMCNMSSHCIGLHTYTAARLVSLMGLLSRRVRWVARRTKKVVAHRRFMESFNMADLLESLPMLGSSVASWSKEIHSQHVDESNCDALSKKMVLAELLYLDAQLNVSVQFLRAVIDYQCQCLRPKMLRRNLNLLYALVYSSCSSSSQQNDVLGPFRERLFDEDFDGQAWLQSSQLG